MFCRENFFFLKIRAIPNAKKTEIVGMLGDAVKIKVRGVPEGGRANREILEFLATELKISRKNVEIHSGETSREKLLRISAISRERAFEILGI